MVMSEEMVLDLVSMAEFNDSNVMETFPSMVVTSERKLKIGGLPAVEVLYTGSSSDTGSGGELYYWYNAIIDEENEFTYQLFAWGQLTDYHNGSAKKTMKLIVDSFTILGDK